MRNNHYHHYKRLMIKTADDGQKYFHYGPLQVSKNDVIIISEWADYSEGILYKEKDCVIF